ncbi:hypothetical protein ACFL3V_06270, partial [Nanoarchaeota archaeon]
QEPKEKPKEEEEEPAEEKKETPKKKVSITEKPKEKMTAQDILDQLDDIPEYEDVFRHVNRDHEEIKPK